MITLNEQHAQAFLTKHNIANSTIVKIAGDASFRSYYRIFAGDKKWILMFAPPSHEEILPFINIDRFLRENGFSAPEIFAIDETHGFMLLEDLDDDTYSKALLKSGDQLVNLELEIYKKACDCLVELHKIKPPEDLPQYDDALLLKEVSLFEQWYLPFKKINITQTQIDLLHRLWIELFAHLSTNNHVLVLRDFHADNLMALPQRQGYKQVGLLDFQDAVIGSRAYDLVSLLEDARRDLHPENRQKLFDYYLEQSGCDVASFTQDYAILSLQRNIKIIGIFARLSLRDNKDNYLTFLPRLLNFITARVLSNDPIFSPLSKLLANFI